VVLKYSVPLDIPLSVELCEFIGAFIGDGCLYRHDRTGCILFTGDPTLDRLYYHEYMRPLAQKIFNITPSIILRPERLMWRFYSRALFDLLVRRFLFSPGPKAFIVRIPDNILESDIRFRLACLRGLFDTDGGVGFDKRLTYKVSYVRIHFTTASIDLVLQVSRVLDEISISHSLHAVRRAEAFQIQINGPRMVHRYCEYIGFSNPRHARKISCVSASVLRRRHSRIE
jgi:hypothetical protein